MRYIKITKELQDKAIQNLLKQISENKKFSENKVNISVDLKATEEVLGIHLNFTPLAWLKMWSLVDSENGEIGWHGVVERDGLDFTVQDILMYPQYVTGVTVQTDDVEYGNWLMKDITEDQLNHLRFHGHSHVNMGTTPSGVDTTWYNEILQTLNNEDFYIFMIINKRREIFVEIYDLKNNKIYEKSDVIIDVPLMGTLNLSEWIMSEKVTNLKTKDDLQTALDKLDATRKNTKPSTGLEDDFETTILNCTKKDLSNKKKKQSIIAKLNLNAYKYRYFGTSAIEWYAFTDTEKLDIAQDFLIWNGSENVERGQYDFDY